jgi:hypothetical protein
VLSFSRCTFPEAVPCQKFRLDSFVSYVSLKVILFTVPHVLLEDEDDKWKKQQDTTPQKTSVCQYNSLLELTKLELQPMASEQHILAPPIGSKLSLVYCSTTTGPLEIVVHYKWAPFGAKHFMEMVTSSSFTSGVPLMRCIKGFLCQFGLHLDPAKCQDFQETFPDNPKWLPEGKAF